MPTSDPFATDDTAADDSPFNTGGDDFGEGFELEPIPVGVLRGHVKDARKLEKGVVLDIHCDDPNYSNCEAVGLWVGKDVRMLGTVASSLGCTVEQRGKQLFFRDDEGNKGLNALKGKPGLFIFAPWEKDGVPTASIGRFGLPKKGSSGDWDEYMSQSDFSDEQIAALKKSRGGIVPGNLTHLFD
jgi:hypothetical protein